MTVASAGSPELDRGLVGGAGRVGPLFGGGEEGQSDLPGATPGLGAGDDAVAEVRELDVGGVGHAVRLCPAPRCGGDGIEGAGQHQGGDIARDGLVAEAAGGDVPGRAALLVGDAELDVVGRAFGVSDLVGALPGEERPLGQGRGDLALGQVGHERGRQGVGLSLGQLVEEER